MEVLLICTDFRWYAESTERAYTNNGCIVTTLKTDFSIKQQQAILRLLAYMGCDLHKYKNHRRKVFNKRVLDTFVNHRFELVVVSASGLTRETLLKLREKAVIVRTLDDTIKQYKELENDLDLYDLVYSYEVNDIEYLKTKMIEAKPLMGSYDEKLFYPEEKTEQIDVSFVGKMYTERKKILEKLIVDMPETNFKFYGEYAPLRKPREFFKWFIDRRKRTCFVNRNTKSIETNHIYNKSKIVLNIHCWQTKSGWSSRLPEVAATKAFQIVDANPYIENAFGNDIICYHEYCELRNMIEYYLQNKEKRVEYASRGYQRMKDMTRTSKARVILDDAKKISRIAQQAMHE